MAKTPYTASHHVVPLWVYAANFVALLVLMVVTVVAAEIELPPILFLSGHMVNNLLAIGIATVKAILVVMIFMGVWWGGHLVKLYIIVGLSFAALMTIILADYATRGFEPSRDWGAGPETALPRSLNPTTQPITDPTYVNPRPRQ